MYFRKHLPRPGGETRFFKKLTLRACERLFSFRCAALRDFPGMFAKGKTVLPHEPRVAVVVYRYDAHRAILEMNFAVCPVSSTRIDDLVFRQPNPGVFIDFF